MMGNVEEAPPSKLKVAGVVSFYMAAALVMVIVNKAVLNSSPELPYSFLFMQMFITVGLLRLGSVFMPSTLPVRATTWQDTKDLLPLTAVGLAGLIFNTLCLRSVDTTFFQIARGMVLPMTIVVSAIHSRKAPRQPVVISAAIVTVGFMVGVNPSALFASSGSTKLTKATVDAVTIGLIYGLLSSLLTALHAVMRKIQVAKLCSIVQVAYSSNVLCAVLLLPMIALNDELPALKKMLLVIPAAAGESENAMAWHYFSDEAMVFFAGSAVTGFFGLLLSISGLLSIKVTSPVAHMFSSAARNVLQTLLGVAIFGDVITQSRLGSLIFLSAGTLYFTYISSAPKPAAVQLPESPKIEKGEYRDLEKQ